MFKTYDDTPAAYQEHGGLYYDPQLQAWVDVPSAKTYDDAEAAWAEQLYAGYFTLSDNSSYTLLQSGDILEVKSNGFVFRTFSTNLLHKVRFELPYKWAHGDVVEFDVVTNTLGRMNAGHQFIYLRYGTQSYTSGGTISNLTGEHSEHITYSFIGNCPDTYEGWNVTSSCIYVSSTITAPNATGETYSEIRNFKINGKKYGFRE